MALMALENVLLRALLRLSHRRSTFVTGPSPRPFARVEADRMAIKQALVALAKKGLVYRAPNGEPRLTLAGFTVATAIVATTAKPARARNRRIAPVLPLRRAEAAPEEAPRESHDEGARCMVEPSELVSA